MSPADLEELVRSIRQHEALRRAAGAAAGKLIASDGSAPRSRIVAALMARRRPPAPADAEQAVSEYLRAMRWRR